MDINIRNVNAATVHKIEEMAKAKGLSREAYLRAHLTEVALAGEIKETENRYANLVHALLEVVERNTESNQEILNIINEVKQNE